LALKSPTLSQGERATVAAFSKTVIKGLLHPPGVNRRIS